MYRWKKSKVDDAEKPRTPQHFFAKPQNPIPLLFLLSALSYLIDTILLSAKPHVMYRMSSTYLFHHHHYMMARHMTPGTLDESFRGPVHYAPWQSGVLSRAGNIS